MVALSLLRVGRSRIALYAEGSLTTMNEYISILDLGSSPTVTKRVVMPREEMESPIILVRVEVTIGLGAAPVKARAPVALLGRFVAGVLAAALTEGYGG
ncbi:hypothetical protein BHM03_00007549 [Ensete ventricosum]|nr:hypothetical protein BHM03_00007549 [Ensete ventricosum]